jgi:hypothetical protein
MVPYIRFRGKERQVLFGVCTLVVQICQLFAGLSPLQYYSIESLMVAISLLFGSASIKNGKAVNMLLHFA